MPFLAGEKAWQTDFDYRPGDDPESQASEAERTSPVTLIQESYRVLLIDDRRDAILPLEKMLTILNQQVATASDGEAGIEKARQFRPEIILCDIGLPDMDGYAVARSLRSEPQFSSTYLVAVTGYGQEEDRRRAIQAGFDYHITKPVSKEQVEILLTKQPRFRVSLE